MTERESLKLALEALKQIDAAMPFPVAKSVIRKAEEALAQKEQEPLTGGDQRKHIICLCPDCTKPAQPEQIPPSAYSNTHQPEQEPVAYPEGDVVGPCICGSWPGGKCLKCPRITTPPQRTWVGLTDEEIWDLHIKMSVALNCKLSDLIEFAKAAEAKLKEKNT